MFIFDGEVLSVELPSGKTMAELTADCTAEIRAMISRGEFYGINVKINGRLTTSMALVLGHELAHICRSVSIFDPKEGSYVLAIKH